MPRYQKLCRVLFHCGCVLFIVQVIKKVATKLGSLAPTVQLSQPMTVRNQSFVKCTGWPVHWAGATSCGMQ